MMIRPVTPPEITAVPHTWHYICKKCGRDFETVDIALQHLANDPHPNIPSKFTPGMIRGKHCNVEVLEVLGFTEKRCREYRIAIVQRFGIYLRDYVVNEIQLSNYGQPGPKSLKAREQRLKARHRFKSGQIFNFTVSTSSKEYRILEQLPYRSPNGDLVYHTLYFEQNRKPSEAMIVEEYLSKLSVFK